jgi:ABC-type multidrug transport system ATPase subunit
MRKTTDCPDIMKPVESALHVRGLTKRFDHLAVDALDLTVQPGEFYALVGPNGAGKTTTLRMVAGLSRPDAGSVSVFGIDALSDPVAAKQMMAWVSDEPMIYGLDAVSARHVKGLLGDRVRAGCTVIMTTHILEVAERMADRIGVIASGRIVAEGTLAELRQQNGHNDTSLEDLFIALVNVEAAAA